MQNVHVLYLLWRIKFLLLIKFVNLIDKMILTILSYFTPFRKQTTYIHRIFSYKYVSRFTKFLFSTNLPNKMTISEGINVRDFYYAWIYMFSSLPSFLTAIESFTARNDINSAFRVKL